MLLVNQQAVKPKSCIGGFLNHSVHGKTDHGVVVIDTYAVSYTHLDVYKRQLLYSPAGSIRASCGASFSVSRKTSRPRMFRHFVPTRGLHPLAPVSYTHLDVYKRQD